VGVAVRAVGRAAGQRRPTGMQSGRRRVYLRYSPLSIPLPLLLLTVATGVGSGYYVWEPLVRSAVDKAVEERQQLQPRPQDAAAASSPPAPQKAQLSNGA
jgi:hypothetical protein